MQVLSILTNDSLFFPPSKHAADLHIWEGELLVLNIAATSSGCVPTDSQTYQCVKHSTELTIWWFTLFTVVFSISETSDPLKMCHVDHRLWRTWRDAQPFWLGGPLAFVQERTMSPTLWEDHSRHAGSVVCVRDVTLAEESVPTYAQVSHLVHVHPLPSGVTSRTPCHLTFPRSY